MSSGNEAFSYNSMRQALTVKTSHKSVVLNVCSKAVCLLNCRVHPLDSPPWWPSWTNGWSMSVFIQRRFKRTAGPFLNVLHFFNRFYSIKARPFCPDLGHGLITLERLHLTITTIPIRCSYTRCQNAVMMFGHVTDSLVQSSIVECKT